VASSRENFIINLLVLKLLKHNGMKSITLCAIFL